MSKKGRGMRGISEATQTGPRPVPDVNRGAMLGAMLDTGDPWMRRPAMGQARRDRVAAGAEARIASCRGVGFQAARGCGHRLDPRLVAKRRRAAVGADG